MQLATTTQFTQSPAPAPAHLKVVPVRNLLHGITALALSARIHKTDKAVMKTAYAVLTQIDVRYHDVILNIMNSPSPLRHMEEFVATLPDHILKTRGAVPA